MKEKFPNKLIFKAIITHEIIQIFYEYKVSHLLHALAILFKEENYCIQHVKLKEMTPPPFELLLHEAPNIHWFFMSLSVLKILVLCTKIQKRLDKPLSSHLRQCSKVTV